MQECKSANFKVKLPFREHFLRIQFPSVNNVCILLELADWMHKAAHFKVRLPLTEHSFAHPILTVNSISIQLLRANW
ncbi:hypothetical protein J6590_042619 [Homalodisca vitripennis]|nr:hypothetical protein J6590_042619 [Homalodisca vitripennis]